LKNQGALQKILMAGQIFFEKMKLLKKSQKSLDKPIYKTRKFVTKIGILSK
jgi:hypothetical protein